MTTGVKIPRCYQRDGKACFSVRSSNQHETSAGSSSVRYAGREIRVVKNYCVNPSQTNIGKGSKDGVKFNNYKSGCQPLENVVNKKKAECSGCQINKKSTDCSHHELKSGEKTDSNRIPGERKLLGDPLTDLKLGLLTDKQYLMGRMSKGEKGVIELKHYIDTLDKLDEKGRCFSKSGKRVDVEVILFCLAVRESSLQIYDDILKQNPECRMALNGKLICLKRLGRCRALLDYCDQLIACGKGFKYVQLKRIEALTDLGRFSEAIEQIEKTRRCCFDNVSFEIYSVRIHMAKGEWRESKKKLEVLIGSLMREDKKKHLPHIDWLIYCCDHPDKYRIDVQNLRNCSLSESICPEHGFREWFYDGECSEIKVDSPHPLRDFQAGLTVTKGYLRSLMLSWDDRGLEVIKKYFLRLDQVMDKNRDGVQLTLDSEVKDKVRRFCLEARKNGLAFIEDFLRDNPTSREGVWFKLMLLDKLAMYEDVLQWIGKNYSKRKDRNLQIELMIIDSLAGLCRFGEAWVHIAKTVKLFSRNDVIKAVFRLHVVAKEFEAAKWELIEMRYKELIDKDLFDAALKLIDFGDHAGKSFVTESVDHSLSDTDSVMVESLSNQSLADKFRNQIRSDERGLENTEYASVAKEYGVRNQQVKQEDDSGDDPWVVGQSLDDLPYVDTDQPECPVYKLGSWEAERLASAQNYYRAGGYVNALSAIAGIQGRHAGQRHFDVDDLFNKCIEKIWNSD